MARIREEVTIQAPAARVWEAVHEDLANAPSWAGYLRSAEVVGGGKPGPGSRLRYQLDLPGGFQGTLVLEVTTWDRPRLCAGRFAEGPLRGTWSYAYRQAGEGTRLAYEMDYELAGMLRFLGGVLKGQYEAGIREGMRSLKEHLEQPRPAGRRRR
jgi:uncharacterized membrane protein